MAESKKGDSSSVRMKKKNTLEDLDIGNDFFTSWKSMSMAEGDGLDFDLTPASKGNKKQFDFEKADMDFNLDGDFGKISSFNMDMSDLDISPPFKKDGKSKDKSKDSSSGNDTRSSFNIDMADLDISAPFKKDGKSTEKPKESSSRKNDGKRDRFAFTFDFDDFSFDSILEKEGSKAQKDKNKKESSPDGSGCQDKEDSLRTNVIGSMSIKEDQPQKPSLPESRIKEVGGNADLEPTRNTSHSEVAMDDDVTTEHSAATDKVASDKEKSPPRTTIVSEEQPNNSQSIELVSSGPVELEASTANDAMQEVSSDYPPDNEPSGANSSEAQKLVDLMQTNATVSDYPSNNEQRGSYLSEAQNKVDFMHTNAAGSNGEQDANMMSVSGSTCNYKHTLSDDSHLQTVRISVNTNNEKSRDRVEDHVIYDGGKTELVQINSLVKNPCTKSAVSDILSDTPLGKENLELDSEMLKLPLISKPADLSNKPTESRIQPLADSSLPLIGPEKPECLKLEVSTQTTLSSLSSKKTGSAQPSLAEGRSDMNAIQSDKKLGSFSLQHSKTPLRGELPRIQSQENCNHVKICGGVGSADGPVNGKKTNDSSETQIKDMIKTQPSMRQRDLSMKDLDTLSMDINIKSAKKSENPTTLASIPTMNTIHMKECRGSSTEGGKKTPDLLGLKLTGIGLDSMKHPLQKGSKAVGNNSQKSVLLRNKPSDIARFPDIQKQTPSILSLKRTLEHVSANNTVLHPSKRLSQSPITSRNLVGMETSEKVLNKMAPSPNHMEFGRIKSTVGNREVAEIHIPHEMKNKGMVISFSIKNDSNIKLADAYSKELDDLCNMLRRKHDEAKEILARAIVNSNKLLMLNSPQFEVNLVAAFAMRKQTLLSELSPSRI